MRVVTQRSAHFFLFILAILLLAMPALADFEKQLSFSAGSLEVRNLIGEITVKGHGGSTFEVKVDIQGRDAREDLVRIESHDGASAELLVIFPDENNFVYPRMGRGSRTTIDLNRNRDSGWLQSLFGLGSDRGRITVRDSGRGLELWADITIMVPSGST